MPWEKAWTSDERRCGVGPAAAVPLPVALALARALSSTLQGSDCGKPMTAVEGSFDA